MKVAGNWTVIYHSPSFLHILTSEFNPTSDLHSICHLTAFTFIAIHDTRLKQIQ